eukprot:347561-Chlamydomonas_euryale.AAC.1
MKNMKLRVRRATTAAQKLPSDADKQVRMLMLRLVFFCFKKQVPPQLIINMDQTGVALVPVGKR